MTVEIPVEEAAGFGETLASAAYEATARGYKDAVVLVVAWIFAAEDSSELARRSAAFFGGTLELEELGLSSNDLERTRASLELMRAARNAFANLCGGRWGVNNFVWIAGAITDGLGEIASVFKRLVDPTEDIVTRVDRFRDELRAVEVQAQELPRWQSAPLAPPMCKDSGLQRTPADRRPSREGRRRVAKGASTMRDSVL